MVYLVTANNTMKNREGEVVALVETGNKSLISQLLNTEVTLQIKHGDFKIKKEMKDVKINNKTSVIIISQPEKKEEVKVETVDYVAPVENTSEGNDR